jgi:deoxyadenosine/deoxycytidine kinase
MLRGFSSSIISRFPRSRLVQATKNTFSTSANQKIPFKPILVSLEGNIGAGKTTILRDLKVKHPEWVSIDEPVETWSKIQNEKGQGILEVFYNDRNRWSYTFQNCALLTRFENIEKKINQVKEKNNKEGVHIFLTERCLDTDYYVFTKLLFAEGSISKIEIDLYERLLNHLRSYSTPLSAIIYVNTLPELCKERIIRRGRTGEQNITLDYLNSLHHYQSNWIGSTPIPVLNISSNSEEDKVEQFILNMKRENELSLINPAIN